MFLKLYIAIKSRLSSLFLFISLSLFSSIVYSQTTTVFNSSTTWTCPVGVSNIKVESWGAGGAGGGASTGGSNQTGGGGGGGAYTVVNSVAVTPGTTYNITVGSGGNGSTVDGTSGGSSYFNISTALANGGEGGIANIGAGGTGGSGGTYYGGNGFPGVASTSGGGGGSAGTGSNGGNGSATIGATAVTGGGAGGNGGNSNPSLGASGGSPGGGGGGAKKGTGYGTPTGGNGADGKLAITYTQLTYKSQILSVTFGSTSWCAGATRTVTVVVKNVGTATWTDASPDINIGLKWNADADYGGAPSYIPRQNAGNLAPNATGTYTFPLVVPPAGAITENLTADVVYEAVSWFGNNNGGVGPGNVVFTTPLITVTTTPAITTQPITTQTVCEGSAISMSVSASGIVTYQWRKGITPLTDGGTISGSGTATLNISSVTVADAAANYNVVITNSCGSVTSNNSNLSVNSAPVTPSNPSTNSPNCNSVTLSRVGTPPAGISWFWQTAAGGTSTANSSATYSASSSGNYYLRAQNTTTSCWSISSGSAAVIVNLAPAQPSAISGPGSVCSGSTQNYSVTNVAGVTYTWSLPAGWSITSGQGTNSINYVTGATGGTITVIPSNGCGNGLSVNLPVGVDQALYWAGQGTTITGGPTGSDFNTAANWSTNSTTYVAAGIYPGSCNDVVINMALSTISTSTILFSQPATTIKSLNFSLNGSTTGSTIYEAGLRLNNQSLTILGTTTLYAQNNTVNRTTQVTLDAISAGSLFTFVGDLSTNATNPGGGTGECIVYPFSNPVGTINMGKFVVKGNCTFSGVGDDAHPQLNKPTTVVFDGTGTQTITNNNSNGYPIYLGFTTQIGEFNSPTVILTGSNALGFQTINNLIINNSATLDITANQSLNRYIAGTPGTFTMNAGSKLFVRGNSGGAVGSNFPTNFSTAYSLDASSTVEYTTPNGVNQTVFGPITYGNLILTNSSGSGTSIKTAGGNLTIGGNITVNGYTTFDMLTYTGNRSSIGGTLSVAANSFLKLAGSSGGAGTSNFPNNFSTVSFVPTSTVEYNGAGAQSIYSTTYGNLILSTGNTKSASGSLNVANDLTINTTALFNMGSFAHTLTGNWYNNVSLASTIPSTSTFLLNGSVAQTLGGTAPSAFNNLSINNSPGVSLLQDQTVNGILNLIAGNIRLKSNNLTIAGATAISGSPFSSTKMIVADGGGEMRKTFSSIGNYLYPIGDETGTADYSPITLNYTAGTFGGGAYSGVKVTNAKHPNNASTTDFLKRYWTISNSAITSPSFDASGTYVPADIAGTESSISSAKFTGSLPWVKYSVLSANTMTVNAITNTGSAIALSGITNQVLAVSITGGGVTICKGNSVSLGSTVSNNGTGTITYSWSPTTGLSSSTVANPVATPALTTTYTLTVSDGNGITTSTNTTITVTIPPSATISYAGNPFCSTAGLVNVSLTGTAGGTYSSTAGLTINSSTGQINIATSTAASYTVTYTVAASGGCTLFSTTTSVTINTAPSASISYTGNPFCSTAGLINVSRAGNAGGSYSSTSGLSINSSTGQINTSTSTAGIYTVTYTIAASGGCALFSTTTSVTITAMPSATISYAGNPFCSSAGLVNVSLTGTAGGNYSSTAGLTINSSTGQINIATSTASTYTVTYTVAASGGCALFSTTTSVTINMAPSASISYTGNPFCSTAGLINVSRAGTAGGSYSSTAGLSINSATGQINTSTSTAGIYTVTYTVAASGGCALFSTTTSVTITAMPSATISYAGNPFCSTAGLVNVSLTGTAGGTYSSTAGLSINSSTGQINIATSTAASYTVTYTVAASGGCALFSTTTSVTINTAPSASISYAGNPFCSTAGLINVSRAGNAGGSYSSTAGLSINSSTGQINTSTSTAGIYTVTYTVAASGGCALFSTTTSITITALPSATITYAGNPFCSNAGLINVSQTGTSGGTYSSTAGLTLNSSTGQINIATSTAATYTVTYTVAASGGCTLFSTTTPVTIQSQPAITANNSGPVCIQNIITLGASSISGATYSWSGPGGYTSISQNPNFVYDLTKSGVYSVIATTAGGCISNTATTTVSASTVSGLWTGAVSTDWSNTDNWCNGVLPTSSTDVTIPSSVLNMPLLADSRDCNTINVNSGATLTVGLGGTLNIYGAISTSYNNINAVSGTINMSGSAAQTITANSFYNNAIKNLVINNSSVSGVSLGGAVDIYNALTFSGTGQTLKTNDTLTLKSNIIGTAWVGDLTGNTVTGKVTVERYISQHKAWRLLSVPTFGVQTIKQAWQESSTGGSSNPVPGFGTQITSPSASWLADGFDLKSASPSMKTYDAASDSWIGVPTTNTTTIPNINGYLLYVRGDRLATGTASAVTSTTLRTKGKLYKGTLPPLTAIPDTYMSVGNPYASPIDFTQLTLGNGIDNKFYAFDPFIYGYYGYGGYQVLSAVNGWKPVPGGSPVYPSGVVNSTIQSGEAFFVHATTIPSFLPANYTVTFSESAKINGDNLISFARPELGAGAKDEIQSFGVTLFTGSNQSDVVADGNVAVFNDIYTAAIDKYDSKKITASGENFDLKRNGTLLAIEARPSLTARDTLFYNMSKLAKKTYQLRFVADNLEQTSLTPVLIDKYLNTRTTLSISGNSSVNITVNNDAASALANRFMVVFAPQNVLPVTFVNIQAARKDSGIMVTWNIENEKNIRNYDIEKSTDGINFNTIGKVASRNLSNYTMLDRSAGTTACYYRISALSVDGEIKKSGIAKVNSIETNTLISVYPNPVKDNNIQLRFGGRESANYIIRLINTDGKILFAKAIQHKAGTIIESIKPEMTIAHGIYQLEIAKQDGNVTVLQVMF